MHYDPVKNIISEYIKLFPCLRHLFYVGLELLLLRQRYVFRRIKALMDSQTSFRFYDAGAGFCQYSDFVLKQYPKSIVHAVDLKTDYLSSYKSSLDTAMTQRFSYCEGDLQSYLPGKTYDLVCAIDILEHIEDDLAVLRNFYKAMNSGAKLIISTPSDTDEAARFTEEHVRPGYNKDELCDKLMQSGFEIQESIYTYGKWGSLAWKILMRTPLKLIEKNKLFALVLPIYYMLTFTWANLMMEIDLKSSNPNGTGILIIALKR